MKRLKFNKESCIGCQLCAQVCSAYKEGEYIPSKARIAIETYYDKGALKYADHYCILCGICAKACPCDAITIGEYIEVDMDKCSGCGLCAEKCPKKVVRIREDKAYICDTCKGDPKCVKTCPQHALTFSHRILALHDGGVAALGDAGDTLTPELIWQLYQVEIDFVDTQQGRVIVPHRGGSL